LQFLWNLHLHTWGTFFGIDNANPNPKPIQRNKHLGISQRMDVEGSKLLTSEEIGLFHGDLSVDNDIENN